MQLEKAQLNLLNRVHSSSSFEEFLYKLYLCLKRIHTVYRPCNFFRLFLTSLTLLVVRRKFFESVERNSYFFFVGLIAFKILC